MQFNSALLREQSTENANKLTLENSVKKSDESFLYSMLEFNDIMHKIDVDEKINYYRALAEFSNDKCTELVLSENIIGGIYEFIKKAIQAILDLFSKFINFIRGKAGNAVFKEAKKNNDEFNSIKNNIDPNSPLAKFKDLKIYVRPSINEIPERYMAASLNNLMDLLDRILIGEHVEKTAIENAYAMAYKTISKCIVRKRNSYNQSIVDSKSFRECVQSDSCYVETRNMQIAEYLSTYPIVDSDGNNKKAAEKLASIKSVIEKADSNIKSKSAAMDPSNKELASKIIAYCKNISSDIVWYFDTITNYDIHNANYWNRIYGSAKSNNVRESATIHGELFNGDTLFDNDDSRDFNRTEWLDLELTTECFELSSAIYEYRRRVAINEALIISENQSDVFRKLIAMQEAEAQKLGDRFMEIIQSIIAAVDKFFSNLRDKLSLDANFIKKNRETIESNPVTLRDIKSNGDIINGLDRIQNKVDLVPYNYDTMKESLEDERKFFNRHIRGKLNGALRPGVSWDDTKFSVAELCKAYFGASIPEDKAAKVDISAADLTSNIKKITSFLEAPNALMANIRAELNSLKVQAKKAATEANASQASSTSASDKPENNPPAQIGDGKTDTKSTNESMYYSELYQRWFTEADFETPASSNNGSSTSENGANSNNSNSKDGFKSYIQAYRSVLLAKLTGAGFVRSELMSLIKAHVNIYNPKASKEAKSDTQQQDAPAQENK